MIDRHYEAMKATFDQMREIAMKSGLTILTARQAPRPRGYTTNHPHPPISEPIFIDYVDILK